MELQQWARQTGVPPARCSASRRGSQGLGLWAHCMFIVREGPTDRVIWNLKRKECPWRLVCLELERRLVREVGVWGPGGGPL